MIGNRVVRATSARRFSSILAVPYLVIALTSISVLQVAGAMSVTGAMLQTSLDESQRPSIEDIALVSTDPAAMMYGCEAINVLRVDTGNVVYLGPPSNSPSRMAASPDLSVVVAINSALGPWIPGPGVTPTPADSPSLALPGITGYGLRQRQRPPAEPNKQFIYVMRRAGNQWWQWDVMNRVVGAEFALTGGLAVLPDGDTLLTGTSHGDGRSGPIQPPYRVEKYRLNEITGGAVEPWTHDIGPLRGSTAELPAMAAEILPADGGRLAHIITEDMKVITVNTVTMAETTPRIQLGRIVPPPRWPVGPRQGFIQADLSLDERYLITNRGVAQELNVADLLERTAWTVPLEWPRQPGRWVTPGLVGGVAMNRAAQNRGLLAVAGEGRLNLFRFEPPSTLELLGRSEPLSVGGNWPASSIAWSARGDKVIGAHGFRIDSTFYHWAIFDVDDLGRTVTLSHRIADCHAGTLPNDIVTANGYAPTPTSSPTASPTGTSTATFTATATNTAKPSATRPVPMPIYLPAAISESCNTRTSHVDVALILDVSTSMLRPTGSGRSKLAAAQEAAEDFLQLLDLSVDPPQRDQVAIVGFNDEAWTASDLTADQRSLERALNRLTDRAAEGTRLDLALEEGITVLQSPQRMRANLPVLVLLTDGLPNRVPTPEPSGSQEESVLAIANQAKALGFEVFTIGLGTPDAQDVADRINRELLMSIASRTDWYFETPDAESLADIYFEISEAIECR